MTFKSINNRSNEIFKELVESYVETGEPVGSRTLSKRLNQNLSPATIRNIMADLEEAGLLYAPHTSAGRLPTDHGLRYFVNALLEVGDLNALDKAYITEHLSQTKGGLEDLLQNATHLLSGLSKTACIVSTPKVESPLTHIEFVSLSAQRILVVLVDQDGGIENRVITIPDGFNLMDLGRVNTYINQIAQGKTLSDVMTVLHEQRMVEQSHLDQLTQKLVQDGLAVWSDQHEKGSLIVRGQSHLLNSIHALEDLETIRRLFNTLDTKESMNKLLDAAIHADGVQIFIGSESDLFTPSGCSMVIAPYQNHHQKIIGAIGVVGPSRMNYSRIIPMVDYTAKLISTLIR